MKLAVRTTAAAFAAVTTAGVSTLAFGVAPAFAAPSEACGPTGDLVAPGICEQSFTDATAVATFTPPTTTRLDVLLVGAGGNANFDSGTNGYASAGGGGEVRVVDLTGTTADIDVEIGEAGNSTELSGGVSETAAGGSFGGYDSSTNTATGGSAGANSGATVTEPTGTFPAAGGAGRGGSTTTHDGGAGLTAAAVGVGTLFAGDTRCFGGGGAAGVSGSVGVADAACGGGAPNAAGTDVVAPRANSGGGGGAVPTAGSDGASGIAIFRWTAATVTLTFAANGHGTAPAPQAIVAGNPATKPADPTATGYQFDGWYTDASLTTLADFSAGVTASTTYYAKWVPALAPTGSEPSVVALGSAIAALLGGAAILAMTDRRRRRAD